MGYWEQDSSGNSFTGDGHTLWGDHPADIMDDAVDKIVVAFTEHIGRPPTVGEIKSGLLFALGGLKYADDDVLHTRENDDAVFDNLSRQDGNKLPVTTLAPDWADHCQGTYS